jgi:hypothetical protein
VVTPSCGFEIDDVVRMLEGRGAGLDHLNGVERRSPFDADLSFDDERSAARLVAVLGGPETPAEMRSALVGVTRSGSTVAIRFRDVDRVRLEEIRPAHVTSCILHTGQGLDPGDRHTRDTNGG